MYRFSAPIVILALGFGLLLTSRNAEAQTAQAASPVKAPSLARVEAALQRGVAYFNKRGTIVRRTDVLMLIDILGRHFNYPLSNLSVDDYIQEHGELKRTYFKCYKIAYDDKNTIDAFTPDEINAYLIKNKETMEGRTLWCMFCNLYPLPSDFIALLNHFADTGKPYELTQVALQYQWALENGCLDGTTELEKALENKLLKGLQAIGEKTPGKIEAAVVLYYMNRPDLVKAEWLEFILNAQQANGGWTELDYQTETSDHTTILAMWALLAYRQHASK